MSWRLLRQQEAEPSYAKASSCSSASQEHSDFLDQSCGHLKDLKEDPHFTCIFILEALAKWWKTIKWQSLFMLLFGLLLMIVVQATQLALSWAVWDQFKPEEVNGNRNTWQRFFARFFWSVTMYLEFLDAFITRSCFKFLQCKCCTGMFILLPKFLIAFGIGTAGIRFIAHADSDIGVIRNATALAFLLRIDNTIFSKYRQVLAEEKTNIVVNKIIHHLEEQGDFVEHKTWNVVWAALCVIVVYLFADYVVHQDECYKENSATSQFLTNFFDWRIPCHWHSKWTDVCEVLLVGSTRPMWRSTFIHSWQVLGCMHCAKKNNTHHHTNHRNQMQPVISTVP